MKRLLIVNVLPEEDPAAQSAIEDLREKAEEVQVIHAYEKMPSPHRSICRNSRSNSTTGWENTFPGSSWAISPKSWAVREGWTQSPMKEAVPDLKEQGGSPIPGSRLF